MTDQLQTPVYGSLRSSKSQPQRRTGQSGVHFTGDEKKEDGDSISIASRPGRPPSRGMQRWRSLSKIVGVASAFQNVPIKVFCRVRPFLARELQGESDQVVSVKNGNHLVISRGEQEVEKAFSGCFWSVDTEEELRKGGKGSQEDVFETAALPLIESAFNGFDCTLIAYGSTGSGKSYTIFGGRARKLGPPPAYATTKVVQSRGVIDMLTRSTLQRLAENRRAVPDRDNEAFTAQISFLEIYNEQIRDLLAPDQGSKKLKLREYPNLGLYIEGLSKHPIESYDDFERILELGKKSRSVLRTKLSEESSRAHTIMTLYMNLESEEIKVSEDDPPIDLKGNNDYRTSKLTIVDLAGSERSDNKQNRRANVDRLKEAMAINKSLLALNRVIRELWQVKDKEKKENKTFGHKDSILTRVLHESFGGNCRTVMIATMSPAESSFESTAMTVQYADMAQSIMNKPRVNRNSEFRALNVLHAEVAVLKRKVVEVRLSMKILAGEELGAAQIVLDDTVRQISERERVIEELETPPEIREEKAREMQAKFELELQRLGVSVGVGENEEELRRTIPHLVQLTDDASMGSLVYFLRPDKVLRFGSASSSVEVVLFGIGIQGEHCSIQHNLIGGKVVLTPLSITASVCVNGTTITAPIELETGDRVVLGTTYFFRFVNPVASNRNSSPSSKGVKRSFTFSRARAVTQSAGPLPPGLLSQMEARHRDSVELSRAPDLEETEGDGSIVDEDEYEEALKELHHQDLDKMASAFAESGGTDDVPEKLLAMRENLAAMKNDYSELESSLEKNRTVWTKVRLDEALSTLKVLKKSIDDEEEKLNQYERVVRDQAQWETDIMTVLARTFPQVREANGYAEMFKKPAMFELRLVPQIVQFGSGELDRVIRGDVAIVYTNAETMLTNEWDYDRFTERMVVMRELYAQFMATGVIPDVDRDLDPFYESPEVYRRIGQASISLQSLCYLFPVEGPVSVLANSGEIACQLNITMKPIVMIYDVRGHASPLQSPASMSQGGSGSDSSFPFPAIPRRDSRTPDRRDSARLNPAIERVRGITPQSSRGRAMSFMENPDDLVGKRMDVHIEVQGVSNNNTDFKNGVFCRFKFWGMDEVVETIPSLDNGENSVINHTTTVRIDGIVPPYLEYLYNETFIVDVFANAAKPKDTQIMMDKIAEEEEETDDLSPLMAMIDKPERSGSVIMGGSVTNISPQSPRRPSRSPVTKSPPTARPTKILTPIVIPSADSNEEASAVAVSGSLSRASSEGDAIHQVFRHDDNDEISAVIMIQSVVRGNVVRAAQRKRLAEEKMKKEAEAKKRKEERKKEEEEKKKREEEEKKREEARSVQAELEALRKQMAQLQSENERLQSRESPPPPSRRLGPRPRFQFLTAEARQAARMGYTDSKACTIL